MSNNLGRAWESVNPAARQELRLIDRVTYQTSVVLHLSFEIPRKDEAQMGECPHSALFQIYCDSPQERHRQENVSPWLIVKIREQREARSSTLRSGFSRAAPDWTLHGRRCGSGHADCSEFHFGRCILEGPFFCPTSPTGFHSCQGPLPHSAIRMRPESPPSYGASSPARRHRPIWSWKIDDG